MIHNALIYRDSIQEQLKYVDTLNGCIDSFGKHLMHSLHKNLYNETILRDAGNLEDEINELIDTLEDVKDIIQNVKEGCEKDGKIDNAG